MQRVRGLLALVVFGALAGCSGAPPESTQPERYPIRGTFTYNGKPLKGAHITFWPLPLDKSDWRTIKPTAVVNADGSFAPRSYAGDGGMAGEYALTMAWFGENGGPDDLTEARYSNPASPILKVTIKPGENVLPPIQMKGPPLKGQSREFVP